MILYNSTVDVQVETVLHCLYRNGEDRVNQVIFRRLRDAGYLSRSAFFEAFDSELDRLRAVERRGGGDFYLTQPARSSKRFTRALIASTLEGQTLFRDAMRMLGISKVETLHKLGAKAGGRVGGLLAR